MAAAEAMSKDHKKRAGGGPNPPRAAFWNGILEGLSGPLMMGVPVRGCLRSDAKTERRTFNIKIDGGMIVVESASLARSSKQIAAALQHATKGVMDSQRLVYRILNDRTVGKDGKFHPVKRMTIEAADPSDDPRQQPRVNAHFAPRRG